MKINLKEFQIECKRCGYRWIPRKVEIRICPKCKSPYWDKIKNLRKNFISKKDELHRKRGVPNEKELIDFIKKRDVVNYSTIAKFYKINNATVSDIINALAKKKLVNVKKLRGSKIVRVK